MSNKVLDLIKENEAKWVDFRFTDTKGKEQHVSYPAYTIDEDTFVNGKMFDGSSIAGWKGINESDMILMPEPGTAFIDPFFEETTLVLTCDVIEPATMQGYERDPRSVAKRALAYLQSTGIADTAFFGPENEFFIFDSVRWDASMKGCFVEIDAENAAWNSGRAYEHGNMGHRPRAKGGYFPVAPVDSAVDIRAEMVSTMLEMGLPCDKHHHEVAAAQHELGLTFGTLVQTADRMQIYKYVVHQVAHAYGKTATFIPQPRLRTTIPKAELDLPLPLPVSTSSTPRSVSAAAILPSTTVFLRCMRWR